MASTPEKSQGLKVDDEGLLKEVEMLLGKKVDVRKSLIYTNVPDSTCLSLPGTPAALVVTSSLQASARFAKGQP